jgi:hypothetical protein
MASPLPGAILICSALDGQCCGPAARAVVGPEVLTALAAGIADVAVVAAPETEAAEVTAGPDPDTEHPPAAASTAAARTEPASAEAFMIHLILMMK